MYMRINKLFFLLFILIFCVGCDQTTKFAARNLLDPDSVLKLFGDTIRLQLASNEGSFLGLGSSLPDEWKFWIFTVFVSIALVFLLIYYLCSKTLLPLSSLALSLIISGGLSNLIDRIIHDGTVIDFLNIGIGNFRTGILNVADIAITSGIILLVYITLTSNRGRNNLIVISKQRE